MTDSTNDDLFDEDKRSELDKLVTDILIDAAQGTRPANNYLDRRLALIDDFVGGMGLNTVDERLAEEITLAVGDPSFDEDARTSLLSWASAILMRHAGQSQLS